MIKVIQWSSPKVRGFTINVMAIMEKEDEEAFSVSAEWNGKLEVIKHFLHWLLIQKTSKGYF